MADVVVAMNRPSLDKFESHVKPGGVLVINSSLIDRKAERTDIQVVYCDANRIAESVGNPRVQTLLSSAHCFRRLPSLMTIR